MKQKIKLSTIIDKHLQIAYLTSGVKISDTYATHLKAMANEIFELALDLAAENATTIRINYFDGTESQQLNGIDIWEEDSSVPCYLAITDKDSILQIKNWIK